MKRLEKLAIQLHRFQPLVWLMVAISGGLLIFSLATSTKVSQHSLLYLCGLLWALSLILLIQGFSSPLPTENDDTGFIEGLRLRFLRFSRWLLSVTFLGTCGFLVFFTFRAIGLMP